MTVDPFWIRNPSDEQAVAEGFYVDEEAGEYACDFIETFCKQSKGRQWAGQPIELLDWQRDLIMRLFGWKRPDGRRRFRRCYCEVAKKNGKSTLIAGLALLMLLADGEGAPEIYLNACDRGQASIIFDESARMVKSSPDLASRLEIVDSKKRIVWPEGNGVIIANSAEAPNKDGLNPSTTIFDELHRQPDFDLWDIFEYASSAREQPLTISITTAGESEDGVWFEQREYSERVNRGEIQDLTHLGVIYRALPSDDVDDPETWRKANPSLGVTISEEDFARELQEAKETPRKLAGFLRLRLNIVASSDVRFITPEAWEECRGPVPIDPSKLRGESCYAGADLSTTTDVTALVAIWGDPEAGFDVAAWFYMPAENVLELEKRDKVTYRLWIEQGFITTTPGNVVDYEFIRRDVNALGTDHDLKLLLIDPYNATKLAIELKESDGLPVDFLRQGYLSLSAPTKELERLILGKRLRHGGNPVLRWMMSNAITEKDAAGNIKLSKRKSRQKIDGASALVNAIAAATGGAASSKGSIYDERDLILL